MSTAIAPFRKELRRIQAQHPLFQSIHPFWRACFRGRLQVEDLQRWALDAYPVVHDFARLYLQVATQCDDERTLTFLAETIFEETGGGVALESHPTLFRRFINALGVPSDEIPESAGTSAGREVWDYSWRTVCEGPFLKGLTLVGLGIERPLPTFFEMVRRAFQTHYELDDEAVKFFSVHTVADVKHSQLAARLVSELARTPEQQQGVRAVLTQLWDLQRHQLDELFAANQGMTWRR